MPVSLKKPPKVDLSKPPLEPVPIREITPEHILEEYTPFEERVITPIHTKSEDIPKSVKVVQSEPLHRVTPNKHIEMPEKRKTSKSDVAVRVISVIICIAFIVFSIWCFFCLLPSIDFDAMFNEISQATSSTPSETSSTLSELSSVLYDAVEFLHSNSLIKFMFLSSFIMIGVRLISKIRDLGE